jgi:hypothetical protein
MVLEALAAVGLTANILQLLDFSHDLLTGAAEIRNSASGSTAENDAFQLIAVDLSRLTQTFIIQATSTASSPSADDVALSNIATATKEASDQLLEATQDLRNLDKPPRKWRSFSQALKAIWEKEKINNLARKLERLRDQLSLHAISRIWYGYIPIND